MNNRQSRLALAACAATGLILLLSHQAFAFGGGAGKTVKTFGDYQSPGATLTSADAAKLARYDMFSFNRKRYYEISPNTYSAVRAINPNVTILNYQQCYNTWLDQDAANVRDINNIARYNTSMGHSMGNLNTDNPSLFLLNSSGARILFGGSSNELALDFGNPRFQAYWLEATIHDIVDQPWQPNGILIDNMMPIWASYFCPQRPANYPDDASFTAAIVNLHAVWCAGLHARGMTVLTNSDCFTDAPGYAAAMQIDALADRPDYLLSEYTFVHHGGSAPATFYDETKWKRQLDAMVNLQNCAVCIFSHVEFTGGTSTDNYGKSLTYYDALWYAMGSYLLGQKPTRPDTFFFSDVNYYKLYWFDEYDHIDLGAQLGNYTLTNYGTNIYRREYQKGYVYVNPTTLDCASIPLPQACKQLSHDTILQDPATFPDVTSIPLVSHRAAIVLKTSTLANSAVLGRRAFYNNSAFDGNDPAAGAADDAAIATDKQPLTDGQIATFANYTSYSRGINGVMVDISNLAGTPTASDFTFKVGNNNSPTGWTTAPTPTSVTVRAGAGTGASSRVTIIWADGAIANQWLQVTVKTTAATGITTPDVFYFGNGFGETGNSTSDAQVTPTDEVGVRNHTHTLAVSPAAIDDAYDFNRDRKVGPADQVICRNNATNSTTALKLIALVTNQAPVVNAGQDALITLPTNQASLDGTVTDDGYPQPFSVTWSKVSGPGTVTFANASAVDTTATFSGSGLYVLQLQATDGDLIASDTVQVQVNDANATSFFEDNFDDNNLVGWTTLSGAFETFQFPGDTGYEVHSLVKPSRMIANLANTALSDTVHVTFQIRHTYGAPPTPGASGYKHGHLWLVNDSGVGFGIYFALDRSPTADEELEIHTTTDNGATSAAPYGFAHPPDPGSYAKQAIHVVYDRVNNSIQCFYNDTLMGTTSVSASYKNFTKVVLELYNPYDGAWGQVDADNIKISSAP